jgi:hypothetical protein
VWPLEVVIALPIGVVRQLTTVLVAADAATAPVTTASAAGAGIADNRMFVVLS